MPAKTTSRKNVRQDPAVQGLMDAAYHQQKIGNTAQAELLYQKVLSAEPGNPFALYALGACAMMRGQMASAVPFFRQALGQGYLHETVFTHLGIALQASGQLDEALEVYRVAEKGDPKNPRYAANAAVVLAQKNDFPGAVAEARKAQKLAPGFAPNLVNLGFFLQDLGQLEEAAEAFEKAVKLDPSNEPVKSALLTLRQKIAAGK
jgi:tetratricopeptide (TPR) repeat protein